MSSFAEHRSEIVQARLTPSQVQQLDELAAAAGVGRSDFLRMALDYYCEHQLSLRRKHSGASGSAESGSKSRPAASTAKVKATGKTAPSKRQSRTQESH